MKAEDIKRLRSLLEKATPGPWQAMNPYQWDSIIGDIDGPDDGDMHYEGVTDITFNHDRSRANAALIVAAVNALPSLLALYDAVMASPVVDLSVANVLCSTMAGVNGAKRVRLVPDCGEASDA